MLLEGLLSHKGTWQRLYWTLILTHLCTSLRLKSSIFKMESTFLTLSTLSIIMRSKKDRELGHHAVQMGVVTRDQPREGAQRKRDTLLNLVHDVPRVRLRVNSNILTLHSCRLAPVTSGTACIPDTPPRVWFMGQAPVLTAEFTILGIKEAHGKTRWLYFLQLSDYKACKQIKRRVLESARDGEKTSPQGCSRQPSSKSVFHYSQAFVYISCIILSLVGQNFLQKLIFFMLRVVHIVQEAIKISSSHSLCKFSLLFLWEELRSPSPMSLLQQTPRIPIIPFITEDWNSPLNTTLSLPLLWSSSKFLELVYGPHPSLDIHHPTQTLALSELKFLPIF